VVGVLAIEGPIIGALVFYTLQQELSQYRVWYLVVLGSTAVVAGVWFRGGIWGVVRRRFDIQVFPVQRRVRLKQRG